jgi:outer membrane immunogenic protein
MVHGKICLAAAKHRWSNLSKYGDGGINMNKNLLGWLALATLGLVECAAAADLPFGMPVKAPPMAAFSWTGCYLGGYAGGAWNSGSGATFTDQGQNGLGAAGSTAVPPFQSYSGGAVASRLVPPHSWNDDLGAGVSGGGTLGCNWQAAGSPYVLGIEGEGGYLHLTGRGFDPNTVISTQTTPDVLGSAKVGDWYGMVTGRLGYAADRFLFYVKGGAAFVPTRSSVFDACQSTGCGNWLIATSGSDTVTTWTVGGGVEWAFAQNWSVKGEYMFIGLGENSGFQSCGSAIAPSGNPVGGGPFCFNTKVDGIQTFKLGLNYRFF